MKANLKDILESIPDFEDFLELAAEIGELSTKKLTLENKIKEMESTTFRSAMRLPLENGKLPSAAYVNNSVIQTGMNGEITPLREELAQICGTLDKKRIQLSIYRDMLEVFRTVSANERSIAV